jgi:hypothetical protein
VQAQTKASARECRHDRQTGQRNRDPGHEVEGT